MATWPQNMALTAKTSPNREEYDAKFAQWQQTHQPFHWWIEFYGIMKTGRVRCDHSAIHPTWSTTRLEKNTQLLGYQTESCGNLYGLRRASVT